MNSIGVYVDNYKRVAIIYIDKEMKNKIVMNGEICVKTFYDIYRTAIAHENMMVRICRQMTAIFFVIYNRRNSSFSNIWRADA